MRRLLTILGLALGLAAPLNAQVKGVRFEITAVGDTTLSFAVGTAQWVRKGLSGIAVDPRRRDALVARFRIVDVNEGIATAVITGQTTRTAMDQVAILDEPTRSLYRTLGFWGGVVIGFALGAVAGAQF
jgi:hypothetical protein